MRRLNSNETPSHFLATSCIDTCSQDSPWFPLWVATPFLSVVRSYLLYWCIDIINQQICPTFSVHPKRLAPKARPAPNRFNLLVITGEKAVCIKTQIWSLFWGNNPFSRERRGEIIHTCLKSKWKGQTSEEMLILLIYLTDAGNLVHLRNATKHMNMMNFDCITQMNVNETKKKQHAVS